MEVKNKKPTSIKPSDLKPWHYYYAVGKRGSDNVQLRIQFLRVSSYGDVDVKTAREDYPDSWQREISLPASSVKFYKESDKKYFD